MNPETLRRQALKLLEQADKLDRVPPKDPFKDGAVLTFEKYVPATLTTLHYAAVRAEGVWYVSGRYGPNAISWQELIKFIGVDNLDSLREVTVTRPVVRQ